MAVSKILFPVEFFIKDLLSYKTPAKRLYEHSAHGQPNSIPLTEDDCFSIDRQFPGQAATSPQVWTGQMIPSRGIA
jgi:hypothetical protein